MAAHTGCAPKAGSRPRYEAADVFRAHGAAYRRLHALTPEQRAAMRAIEVCRTQALGGHLDVCQDCGSERPSYNSCRNRHCPKCQALAQARWLEKRRQHLLPVPYFHVVFTVPRELRALARRHPRPFYTLLMRAAAQTLLTLGRDPKRLGAVLGVTAVLHTWTRDLRFHPHVHCIVTGGGLSLKEERWVSTGPKYLFPVKVLARLFRGKLLTGLKGASERGEIEQPEARSEPEAFADLQARLARKNWNVYAKRPFAGPDQVYSYLGQYTHRVGISNHRIQDVSEDHVTIATRNGGSASMTPLEFIRRFLQHVLPKGFVKIRHFGLLASGNLNTRLAVARRVLGPPTVKATETDEPASDWRRALHRLTGIDVTACPVCGSHRLHSVPLPGPLQRGRARGRAPP